MGLVGLQRVLGEDPCNCPSLGMDFPDWFFPQLFINRAVAQSAAEKMKFLVIFYLIKYGQM